MDIKYAPVVNSSWWIENVKYLKFRRQGIDIIGAQFEQPGNNARANVIVLCGWSETFLKYSETIKFLYDRGFNVYTYDHQSQGLSGRWLSDTQSTWIHTFDDYVDDFTFFVTSFTKNTLPIFVVCSSMGGLVAGIAMSRLPNLVNRAVFLAPMFRNKCSMKYNYYRYPLPQLLTYWITKFTCWIGLGKKHVLGFFNESPSEVLPLFTTTSNKDQLNNYKILRQRYPTIISSCVTNDWLIQSLLAQQYFESRYQYVVSNCLIICAENDYFVHNRAITAFSQKAQNCKVFYAPNSYHEIWCENDIIRGSTLKAISDFFTQVSDDVRDIQPSTPLVLYDHSLSGFSLAETVIRASGIFFATMGIIIGIGMVTRKS